MPRRDMLKASGGRKPPRISSLHERYRMAVATELPTDTFDALHARLGRVPLTRIRTKPAPGTATEKDLLKPHGPICELIDGVLVEKAMGDRESLLGMYIGRLIGNHVELEELGVVLGADGFIRVE